ncbi:MAG: hypothetical protein M3041_01625 [Acidobacteriota bacterium]|nr:hypothetical protein [Acidobacteriota bacterium]
MRPLFCATALILAIPLQAIELGKAEGTLTINGISTPLRFAYGRSKPQETDPEKTMILLTSHPLSKEALADDAVLQRMRRQRDVVIFSIWLDARRQPVKTQLYIADDFPVTGMHPEMSTTLSSPRLVDGTMKFEKDFFGDQIALDVTFRAAIATGAAFAENPAATAAISQGVRFPRPPAIFSAKGKPSTASRPKPAPASTSATAPQTPLAGTPLPSGGGEPGHVYVTWSSAFRKGDAATYQPLMTKTAPAADPLVRMSRALQPIQLVIVRGAVNGNTATLKLEGVLFGSQTSGSATLVKQGNVWKVDEDTWSMPSQSALPVPQPVAPLTNGTPLPSDGGAPGAVWRAYDAAVGKNDAGSIRKLLGRDGLRAFDALQFGDFVDVMRDLRAVNARVAGGVMSGNKATLRLQAPPTPRLTGAGTATLVNEDGVWKLSFPVEEWTSAAASPPSPDKRR